MYIAERLMQLRQVRSLSQGDIETRTGLLRCYISRVENGHTVPSLETLEKLSRALEVPLYQLFYEEGPPQQIKECPSEERDWASQGKGKRLFTKLRQAVSRMSDRDRATLLFIAAKMAESNHRSRR